MEIGQFMEWHREQGGYAFHTITRVKIAKIGKARATVIVMQKDGSEGRKTTAKLENLKPLANATH